MTPAQAAHAAGVSRWSILRAIKSHKLQAKRDNRNNWHIAPDDLAAWCAAHAAQGAHTVRIDAPAQVNSDAVALLELREKLAAAVMAEAVATARAEAAERARDQAEGERDKWQAVAEKLAEASARRSWWPFGR